MADKWYTAASGNWSTAANWNGGTLPAAGDDVYADGKAVVIDQTVNVGSIRTTQRTGGTNGGTFTISSTQSISCSGVGIVSGTTSGGILITASAGNTITIVANISGGTINSGYGISISGGCTVNITGNVKSASTPNTACYGINIAASATVNITGNVYSDSTGTNAYGININSAATLNITGSVYTNTINPGINSGAACVVSVVGNTTASSSSPAIVLTSSSAIVTFAGSFTNSSYHMAFVAFQVKLYSTSIVQWAFQDESGADKYLYSAGVSLGNPAEADVRNGTVYGASNELTGTLIVPSPSNVVDGVPTDHTVGTYSTTPALIAAAVVAELGSSTDPIAVRLQNVSTVQTTGAQIASYPI